MKTTALVFTLLPLAAQADILSNFSPFLGSSDPDYRALAPDTPGEDPERAPFSPADSDFGVQEILGETADASRFRFFANLDVNVTDNAPAATRRLEDSSYYTSVLLGGDWQPHLGSGWFGDFGLVQEFYEFERPQALDFQNLNARVGVLKTLVDLDDSVLFIRYEYQRLVTGSWSETDYSAQRIRAGLQKTLFARSNQELAAGISVAVDLDANPELLERNEYAAELSYTWWFRENLGATASWRGAMWDFDRGGREDWNHVAGVELHWRVCDNASAYTHVFYSNNDSNSPLGVNDFESWHAGAGLGIQLTF